ncbi:spore germination protein GerPE [Paenibacillus oenotherae]|uniref:Spore germination protein GerPE n=1 Tax=Paenibacillus oenotherae TaxID=1435645 RepID=A0ABS7D2S4_9BACL|nr:spore germination protein GerPE [Paenibacillus oenotherae]MBW7474235.1 spore germination protein GerPE [Paenibacillus oenotherae]
MKPKRTDDTYPTQLPASDAEPYDSEHYPIRTSELGALIVNSISGSSIIQLGDRKEVAAKLLGLAVQREVPHTEGGDVYFESYAIFDRPLPSLIESPAEDNSVVIRKQNFAPCIRVGGIKVLAMSGTALMLIGLGSTATAESRISNIRQFARRAIDADPCMPPYRVGIPD